MHKRPRSRWGRRSTCPACWAQVRALAEEAGRGETRGLAGTGREASLERIGELHVQAIQLTDFCQLNAEALRPPGVF